MSPVLPLDALQRRALWLVLATLALGLLIVATGLYASTSTENLSTTGWPSGVIVSEWPLDGDDGSSGGQGMVGSACC